jgi:predicted DNA-binding transcriptional regulator AlpA
MSDFITEKQLAERWGKTPRTLYNLRKAGQVPTHFTIGRSGALYKLTDVEAFEQAQRHETAHATQQEDA